jgi:hypothetical protein
MDSLEHKLRYALVVYVGGARPAVSRQQVADALVFKAGIPRGAFSVHTYRPEDFLVVFASAELRSSVSARPSLEHGGFRLFFRPWTRQAQAVHVVARTRVRLALEGIPPHAWERSTVEHLLGISCTVAEIAPESASREDLGMFRVAAWTAEKEAIPPMRELWIPEPEDFEEETAQPRPISRNRELGLLKYRVLIHLTRVEEFIRVGPSSPRSDRSGLPDSAVSEVTRGTGRRHWRTYRVCYAMAYPASWPCKHIPRTF